MNFYFQKFLIQKEKKNNKNNNSNSIPVKKSPKIDPELYRISFTSSFHKSNEIKKNNKKSPILKKKKNNLILPLTKSIKKNSNSNSNDSNKKLNS